jgi:hypothetical protein
LDGSAASERRSASVSERVGTIAGQQRAGDRRDDDAAEISRCR